ncbi:MAG: hypothetical protein PHX21_10280, partial [bacterium]|nr:hypothetical protein [bacterium]
PQRTQREGIKFQVKNKQITKNEDTEDRKENLPRKYGRYKKHESTKNRPRKSNHREHRGKG